MERKVKYQASRIALQKKIAADPRVTPKTRHMAKLAADAMEAINRAGAKEPGK